MKIKHAIGEIVKDDGTGHTVCRNYCNHLHHKNKVTVHVERNAPLTETHTSTHRRSQANRARERHRANILLRFGGVRNVLWLSDRRENEAEEDGLGGTLAKLITRRGGGARVCAPLGACTVWSSAARAHTN